MGAFRQLGLLLKQTLIERKRNWVLLVLELACPILLFVAIVTVRDGNQAIDKDTCNFAPQALPSAGILPFMQSTVCSLQSAENRCIKDSRDSYTSQVSSSLSQLENTLLDSGDLLNNVSQNVEESLPALTQLYTVLQQENVQAFLTVNFTTEAFFEDSMKVREILKENGLDDQVIDAIMRSQINIAKVKDFITMTRDKLCNSTADQSSLRDYLVLPDNASVDIEAINKAICNIPEDSVGALVQQMQNQINKEKVFSVVKKAIDLLMPESSTVIADIESMVNVLSNLQSLRGFPNVQKLLDIAVNVMKLAGKANEIIDPAAIGELLEQLDPVITSITGDSQVWRDIKRGIYYLSLTMNWVKDTLNNLPDMKLTFGEMFTDGGQTLLNRLNSTVIEGEYFATVLSRASVNFHKLLKYQELLMTEGTSACDMSKAFFDMYDYPGDVDPTRLANAIQKSTDYFCRFDEDALLEELSMKINIFSLIEEYKNYSNSTVGFSTLDWTSIMENGWEFVDLYMRLMDYFNMYKPVIDRLRSIDISQSFMQIQGMFNNATQAMDQGYYINLIASGMDQLQSFLETTPFWPNMKQQFIFQNLYGSIFIEAMDIGIDATNKTHQIIESEGTKDLLNRLIQIGPDVSLSVLKSLMKPSNTFQIYEDPNSFHIQLCRNISGYLDLYQYNASVESMIYNIICQGDKFSFQPLSDFINSRGQALEEKIELLIAVHKGYIQLSDSQLDEYTRLSSLVTRQMMAQTKMTQAIQGFEFTSFYEYLWDNGQQKVYWSEVIDEAKSIVPYTIMSSMLEIMGSILEEEPEVWPVIGRYAALVDKFAQALLNSQQKQGMLLSRKTSFGRIMDFVMLYGPEMITATTKIMNDPVKSQEVMQLMMSGNGLMILCNPDTFDQFYTVPEVPIGELKLEMCKPDSMEKLTTEVMDAYSYTEFQQQVQFIFQTTEELPVDWIKMSHTMVSIPKTIEAYSDQLEDFFEKPEYNYTAWQLVMDDLLSMSDIFTAASLPQTLKMLPQFAASIDAMFYNDTTWNLMKHAAHAVDVIFVTTANRNRNILADGLTLDDLFEDSAEIKNFLTLELKASPMWIDAFFDSLIDPTKLLTELATVNITGRSLCQGLSITQFIEFRDADVVQDWEQRLCEIDWNLLLEELNKDPVSVAVSDAIMPIILHFTNYTYQVPAIALDFEALSAHAVDMLQTYQAMSNFTGPIFPDILTYNQTAINIKAMEGYEKLMNLDPYKQLQLIDEIRKNVSLRQDDFNDIGKIMQQVWIGVSEQLTYQLVGYKVLLQQARAIDGDGSWNVHSLDLPGELKRILSALEFSPEMTDVLLHSIGEVMRNPDKLAQTQFDMQLLDDLCTSQEVYAHFFSLPPEVDLDLPTMQRTMCSLQPNITLLYQQILEEVDGAMEIFNLVNGNIPDIGLAEMYNTTIGYYDMLVKLEAQNLTFTPPRYTDPAEWEPVGRTAQRLLEQMQQSNMTNISQLDMYKGLAYSMVPYLESMVNADPTSDLAVAMRITSAYVKLYAKLLGELQANDWDEQKMFSTTTELSRLSVISQWNPEIFEIVAFNFFLPQKMQGMIELLLQNTSASYQIFCEIPDLSMYIEMPPNNKVNLTLIHDIVCTRIATETVLNELISLIGADSMQSLTDSFNPSSNSTFSGAELLNNMFSLYPMVEDLVQHVFANKSILAERLQVAEWRRVFESITQLLQNIGDSYGFASVTELLPMLELLIPPELSPYVHTGVAIAKVALRKITQFNQTNVDVLSFSEGYPETTKALQLLNVSREMIELLLLNMQSPKFMELASQPDVLAVICSDTLPQYFSLPPDSPVNLDLLQQYVCMINWTLVYEEIITDLDVPYIESQLMNNSTVDWPEVLRVMQELSDAVADVISMRPQFKYYPWMNSTAWEKTMERLSQHLQQQSMSPQAMLQGLYSLAPLIDEAIANATDVKHALEIVKVNIIASLNLINNLEAANFTIDGLYANQPEMKKILDALNELPMFADVLLQTLFQPEKVAPMVKMLLEAGNNSAQVFCQMSDLNQYVVIPAGNTANLSMIQTLVCDQEIDWDAVGMAVSSPLQPGLNFINPENFKFKDLVSNTGELIAKAQGVIEQLLAKNDTVGGLMAHLPSWSRPEVWSGVIENFVNTLNSTSIEATLLKFMSFQQMIGLGGSDMGLQLPELHVLNAVLDVVIGRLNTMNSSSSLDLSTFFKDSPETYKAFNLLSQLPTITEVLITSLNTNKLSALMQESTSPVEAIVSLCTQPAGTYLTPSSIMTLDELSALHQDFCLVNWTIVQAEVMSEVEIENIIAQMNNTSPVDFQATVARISRLSELLTSVIISPPEIILNWSWLNNTEQVWEKLFMRLSAEQQANTVPYLDMASQMLLKVLVPNFGHDRTFQEFGVVMETLLESLKRELSPLIGAGNITVGDLISSNPRLSELLEDVAELTPDIYALMLTLQVKNPGEWMLLTQSMNPQAVICNETHGILRYVDVPEANVSAIQEVICSANMTVLVSDISQLIGVDDIMARIQMNGSANWVKIDQDMKQLIQMIMQLINDPVSIIPPFDVNRLGEIQQNIIMAIDWTDIETYIGMTESTFRFLRTQPFWPAVEPYFVINQIVTGWVNDLVGRLDLKGGFTIDLADLFPNATLLNELVESSLGLSDEFTALIMTGRIGQQQIMQLIQAVQSGNAAFICDVDELQKIFPLMDGPKVDRLSAAICNAYGDNATRLNEQIMQALSLDELIMAITNTMNYTSSRVYNVRQAIVQQMELNAQIQSLINVTQVVYGDVDLNALVERLSNETNMQALLLALSQALPALEVQTFGQILDSMMPLLQSTDWWTKAEPYFRMMNIMSEIGAGRVEQLPTANISLSTIIRNADTFEKLLKDSFAFAPDIIKSLQSLQMQMSPQTLMNITSALDFQEFLCANAEFPESVNQTAVRIILCDTDFTQVLDELLVEFDFDRLIVEIGQVTQYANVTSDFTWTELLTNTNRLAQGLTYFFVQMEAPPIQDFFMYKGNMTEYLQRLAKASQIEDLNKYITQQIGMGLNNLLPMFMEKDEYAATIFFTNLVDQYLDVALQQLNMLNSGDNITLSDLLLDSSELVKLVSSTADAAPGALEYIMTTPMAVNEVISLLTAKPEEACTVELPASVDPVRDAICALNSTALMIEIQANANLPALLVATTTNAFNMTLWKSFGNTEFDWTEYLMKYNELTNAITQLIKNPPTFAKDVMSLVNVTEYMSLIKKVQDAYINQTYTMDTKTFSVLMDSLLPMLQNSSFGQEALKYMQAMDMIMSTINGKLHDIREQQVTLNSLLGDATSLKNYLQASLGVTPELVNTIINSKINGGALIQLFTAPEEVCSGELSDIIELPADSTVDPELVEELLCGLNMTEFNMEVMRELGITDIVELLMSNMSVSVNWTSLFKNSQEFSSLLTSLIMNPPDLHDDVLNLFNSTRMGQLLGTLAQQDPKELLRLFDIFGPALENLAGESWPVVQTILKPLSMSLNRLVDQMKQLQDAGFTFESLLNNRTALTEYIKTMFKDSMDVSSETALDSVAPQLDFLLKKPAVQEMVCNRTHGIETRVAHPGYVDLHYVFCNSSNEWKERLQSRGYSPLYASMTLLQIQLWYIYENGNGTIPELPGPPKSNFSLSDIAPQLEELVDVLGGLNTLPLEMMADYNKTHWQPIIDNFLAAYAAGIPEVIVLQLEYLDPLLSDMEFWKQLQVALRSVSHFMDNLNTQLEEMAAKGENISIVSMLPDPSAVQNLLERAISAKHAAEFLTTVINPLQVLGVVNGDPEAIFCDPWQFNLTFMFPTGVDVPEIQQTLCAATKNDTLILKEVFELFDLKQLAEEVLQTVTGQVAPTAQPTESAYRTVMRQVQKLMQNAQLIMRLMEAFNRDIPAIANWLAPVTATLSTILDPEDSKNYGQMCDAVVNLVDETEEFQMIQPSLVGSYLVQSMVLDVVSSADDFDNLLCDLPNMSLNEIIEYMTSTPGVSITNKVNQLLNEEYLKSAKFSCSSTIRVSTEIQARIRSFVDTVASGQIDVCFSKLKTANFTIINDANIVMTVLGSLQQILDSDILSELISPVQGVEFGQLVDTSAIENLMKAVFTDQESFSTFNSSLINPEVFMRLLNESIPEVQDFMCNSSALDSLILSAPTAGQRISELLCQDSSTLARLLQGIADNVNNEKLSLLVQTASMSDFLKELFNRLATLLGQVGEIGDLSAFIGDLNITSILDNLPQIEKFMEDDNAVSNLFTSLEDVLALVETRLTPDSTLATLFGDLKLVLNGLAGLETVKNSMVVTVPLRKILANPDEFREFLLNTTSLDEQAVESLLDATFDHNLLSEMKSALAIEEQLCEPEKLPSLLTLPNDTSITYEQMSNAICSLNAEQVLTIAIDLAKRVDAATMIELLVSEKLGMDSAQTAEMISGLSAYQKELDLVIDEIQDATAVFNFSNQAASTAGFSSAVTTLCGQPGSLPDSSSVPLFDDLAEDDDDDHNQGLGGIDSEELLSLQSTACQSLYEQIVSSSKAGSLIWKFLKPLIRGKILYTPDNAVTREIIRGANSTFAELGKLLPIVENMLNSQQRVSNTFNSSTIQQIQEALANPLIKTLYGDDINTDALSESIQLLSGGDNQRMFTMMESLVEFGKCMELDRYEGVATEALLEDRAQTLHRGTREFWAAVVFIDADENSDVVKRAADGSLPKHVTYKIRMDIENVESTLKLQSAFYSRSPRSNLLDDLRYQRGFMQIQDMIDRSIINIHGRDPIIKSTTSEIKQMPATCYQHDTFMGYIYPYVVPVLVTLAWMFAFVRSIKSIAQFRESGLEEVMKIMGLKHGSIWCSWFISSFISMLILSALATIFFMAGRIFVLSNGFIVFLFFVTFSLSTIMMCYMISAFFNKASLAAAVGVMFYMISYLPFILYTQFRDQYLPSYHHLSCLMSTTAFGIGATYIARWEQIGEGIQWSNVRKVAGFDESAELTLESVMIWMLVDSLIYFIIGWYFRNILPNKFGARQPWYFPVTSTYWNCGSCSSGSSQKRSKKSKDPPSASEHSSLSSASLSKSIDPIGTTKDSRLFTQAQWLSSKGDAEYADLPVGVSLQGLKKVYSNGKVAVNNLNFDFYEGHVTAFLGRNGAGKTSTIDMLTGMSAPTSGTASVNGYDIRKNIGDVRRNIGYCPQFDMLFDFMTVTEHLEMYASLKSDDFAADIQYDVENMVHNIGLWDVRDELVGSISGGMRRRLSVAIAFIGNSQVIILDEPTSSIDPNGRRAIWDVILKHRKGRTIILCTHHLDEADTLGDRIAVLDKGTLLAEGSPMSLKNKHGLGYQLFLEKTQADRDTDVVPCDIVKLTEFVEQSCPGAQLMTDIGSSVTFTLPTSDASSFDTLFDRLDENLATLGLTGFGVSDSTLDEVFHKITNGSESSDKVEMDGTRNAPYLADFGTSSKTSVFRKAGALMRKRLIHTVKDYKSYFALIILPCLFVALALGVSRLVPDRTNQPNLQLQPSLYPNSYSFESVQGNNPATQSIRDTMYEFPGLGTICMPSSNLSTGRGIVEFACKAPSEPIVQLAANYTPLPDCACGVNSEYTCQGDYPKLRVLQTNTSDHLVSVKNYDPVEYLLSTTEQPRYKTNRYGGWSFSSQQENNIIKPRATVWFNNRAFHSPPAYLNSLNNMILRASIPGYESAGYGITVHNHPMALSTGQLSIQNTVEKTSDLGLSLTILTAFSFIPAGLCLYLVLEHTTGEKHLQRVSGVSPIVYWFTTFFWDMVMFLLPIAATLLLVHLFDVKAYSNHLEFMFGLLILYAWATLPFMYMFIKLFKSTPTAFFTMIMLNLFLGIGLSVVHFLMTFYKRDIGRNNIAIAEAVFMIFPQYSLTGALIQLNYNQAMSDVLAMFDQVSNQFTPTDSNNGIIYHMIAMAVEGVVFFIITLLIEINVKSCYDSISDKKRMKYAEEMDEDVQAEKQNLTMGLNRADSLAITGLSKQYRMHNGKKVLAVNDLAFHVPKGEVFGLCGVNGAGKTTTFRMLTGETIPSEGQATLFGQLITSGDSRRMIGYCPQQDAIDGLLTGRQLLHVYADLKGVDNADQAIANLSTALDMDRYIQKQIQSYSGGMKRKLSVAIALLGRPQLVFLDEPTAGADPVSRRTVWNQILAMAGTDRSVVLTSHSMAECDALCNRMAIMLNGNFSCLGSPQHLKNKFGAGYTVRVKTTGPPPNVTRLHAFIRNTWPEAIIKDCHMSTIEFSIPRSAGKIGDLFRVMENERNNLYVEEYAVFQTTLDQVFIQFARSQQDQVDSSSDGGEAGSYSGQNGYENYVIGPDDIDVDEKNAQSAINRLNGTASEGRYVTKL